jgi:hypothetical protein
MTFIAIIGTVKMTNFIAIIITINMKDASEPNMYIMYAQFVLSSKLEDV